MVDFDKSQYKAKRLFKDEHFENGFKVLPLSYDETRVADHRNWTFPQSSDEPSWQLLQLYSKHCLIEERKDVGTPYVLTDKFDTKTVTYNPEEKSLSFKMDARNIYCGTTEVARYWPHLLIQQRYICDYKNMPEGEEKRLYSANCDKTVVEYDIRVREYIPSEVSEGDQRCQFVCFVYLQHIEKNHIYIGISPLSNVGPIGHFFNKETGGNNYIYALSTDTIFGGIENSFNLPDRKVKVSDEWKHVEVDLTPHIDRILERANEEMVFGRKVTRDEFYFNGCNMGFEIHNNFSCTVEIKNYNLVSYVKK